MPIMQRVSTQRSCRRRRSTGQALVEFALVAPVFFLVFFGIIEFALIMSSVGSFNFASREGARVGSIIGPTDSTADTQIVSQVLSHVRGLVMAKATEIDIFRATINGLCLPDPLADPSTLTPVAESSPSCAKDVWLIASDGTPTPPATPGWPPDDRNDTLSSADYLGVYVTYQYTFLTAFIADSGIPLILNADSVQRIEPQDYGERAPLLPLTLAWPGLDGGALCSCSVHSQPSMAAQANRSTI